MSEIKFSETLATGVAIGLVEMGISTLSYELFGVKLGYGRLGCKECF